MQCSFPWLDPHRTTVSVTQNQQHMVHCWTQNSSRRRCSISPPALPAGGCSWISPPHAQHASHVRVTYSSDPVTAWKRVATPSATWQEQWDEGIIHKVCSHFITQATTTHSMSHRKTLKSDKWPFEILLLNGKKNRAQFNTVELQKYAHNSKTCFPSKVYQDYHGQWISDLFLIISVSYELPFSLWLLFSGNEKILQGKRFVLRNLIPLKDIKSWGKYFNGSQIWFLIQFA